MACGNWSSALRHLVADGTLDGRAVVEGRVTIDDLSRSNEVGMLGVDGRPQVVLKRRGVAVDDVDPLVAEIDCLRWLGGDATTATIAPNLVAVFDDIVVTVAVADAATLSDALVVSGGDDQRRLLCGLGRSLAVLHAVEPDRRLLVARWPWVLDVVEREVPAMLAGDPGIEALVDRVNGRPALVAAIRRLRAAWSTVGAIHGDVKFDNVVVPGGASGVWSADPVLVDWELAGLGPAVWDVAGVVVGMIVPRLLASDAGRVDLDDVRCELEPILASYRSTAGAPAIDEGELLTATVVRMVQTSFQLCAMRHLDPGHDESSASVLDAAVAMASEPSVQDDLVSVP